MPSRTARALRASLPVGALLAALALPDARASAEPLFGTGAPRFAADVSTRLDETGRPSLEVEIQVPYSELQFVRVAAGYGAALEFVVVVRSGKGEVAGDVWEERFVVGGFEETRNPALRIASDRSFRVPAGRYRVKVQVRDLSGGQQSSAEQPVTVTGLGSATLGLADMVFGLCGGDSSGAPVFQRSASRRYGEDVDRFCVQSSVLDLGTPSTERRYAVRWRIRDESAREVAAAETTLAAAEAHPFLLRPPASRLFLGTYELEIQVREGGRKWSSTGSFEIEAVTAPVGAQWSVLLEILEYVATPSEIEPLRKAKGEAEQAQRWKEFWARRDPTPGTARNESLIEFMRRIRYANSQFQGLGPGWRTDQGHIYIRNGAPDQIEDIPASLTSYPTQIWHYFELNRKYVFIDRDGFGRYVLVSESGP